MEDRVVVEALLGEEGERVRRLRRALGVELDHEAAAARLDRRRRRLAGLEHLLAAASNLSSLGAGCSTVAQPVCLRPAAVAVVDRSHRSSSAPQPASAQREQRRVEAAAEAAPSGGTLAGLRSWRRCDGSGTSAPAPRARPRFIGRALNATDRARAVAVAAPAPADAALLRPRAPAGWDERTGRRLGRPPAPLAAAAPQVAPGPSGCSTSAPAPARRRCSSPASSPGAASAGVDVSEEMIARGAGEGRARPGRADRVQGRRRRRPALRRRLLRPRHPGQHAAVLRRDRAGPAPRRPRDRRRELGRRRRRSTRPSAVLERGFRRHGHRAGASGRRRVGDLASSAAPTRRRHLGSGADAAPAIATCCSSTRPPGGGRAQRAAARRSSGRSTRGTGSTTGS